MTEQGNQGVQTILDQAGQAAATAAEEGNVAVNQAVLTKALNDPNSLTPEERTIFNNMRDAFYQGGFTDLATQLDQATAEYNRRANTAGGQANVLEDLGGGVNSGVMNANLALLGGGAGGASLGKDASNTFRQGLDSRYAGERAEYDALLARISHR